MPQSGISSAWSDVSPEQSVEEIAQPPNAREPLVPTGNEEYLRSTVLPLLHDALEELGGVLVQERLQLATGELWDEDGYRPETWTPVDPLQYLTDFFRRVAICFPPLDDAHLLVSDRACQRLAQITEPQGAKEGEDSQKGALWNAERVDEAPVAALERAQQGGEAGGMLQVRMLPRALAGLRTNHGKKKRTSASTRRVRAQSLTLPCCWAADISTTTTAASLTRRRCWRCTESSTRTVRKLAFLLLETHRPRPADCVLGDA